MTWTRPGRIWTEEQAQLVCDLLGQMWTAAFGHIEERLESMGFLVLSQKADV